jgi:hypothetical protein
MALTAERLRELVHYDPDTGIFTRLTDRGGYKAGSIMGTPSHRGYLKLCVDKVHYYAHRLAWFYVHGEMPNVIDHINGNTSDNRLANLRNVDQATNLRSIMRPNKVNTSGYRGVSRKRNRWTAALSLNNRRVSLGSFKTKEEAYAAYVEAKRILHPMSVLNG